MMPLGNYGAGIDENQRNNFWKIESTSMSLTLKDYDREITCSSFDNRLHPRRLSIFYLWLTFSRSSFAISSGNHRLDFFIFRHRIICLLVGIY